MGVDRGFDKKAGFREKESQTERNVRGSSWGHEHDSVRALKEA
jgi:hypothetical protein